MWFSDEAERRAYEVEKTRRLLDFQGDSEVQKFYKISGPFKRFTDGPNKNKLNREEWSENVFQVLKDADWRWTEKLDGTNIRIHWDGYRVTMGGRTDRAELHRDLVGHVRENFPEELFEQMFQGKSLTLYGEGVGAGIQRVGGNYSATKKFILFEVRIGDFWASRETVEDIAAGLGCQVAPQVGIGPILAAIDIVSGGMKSYYGDFLSEGLVGHPPCGLLNSRGGRIALKIKTVDFYTEENQGA